MYFKKSCHSVVRRLIVLFYFRGLTDESEIIKFLQHGTLVGLLPVPHPILIRKYQVSEPVEIRNPKNKHR